MAVTMNIDEEWENFISSEYDDDSSDDEIAQLGEEVKDLHNEYVSANLSGELNLKEAPKPTDIYISTKTIIAYLNTTIDLKELFWLIPTIPYVKPCNGVIKKQMKFNSTTQEEIDFIETKLKDESYSDQHIITHIDNPAGRIKFKDIRKVTIGISKKDIISYRSKKKSAFYNCFVIILRIKCQEVFKEFHVKVFNTGKLEIPGIQSEGAFQLVLSQVLETIQPFYSKKLDYKSNTMTTVLINSNFNCGYFINREALNEILKYKYNIQSIYDPCSYPGIQCKFYYNPDIGIQTGSQITEENKAIYKNIKQVSFMIFRTGSVLIVGKCDESVLMIIYDFLKNLLINEFKNVFQKMITNDDIVLKDKMKKPRRKVLTVEFTS